MAKTKEAHSHSLILGCSFLWTDSHKAAKGARKEANINLKGAHLHVIGDLIQSIGVMIGGALIWINPAW